MRRPTPDRFPPDPRIPAVFEVVRYREVPGEPDPRWHAAVVEDGRETSFTCSHLHHSRETARRCLRAVRQAWESFTGEPGCERRIVQTEPYTVVELVRPGDPGRFGNRGTVSRRFTYPEETR